MSKSNDYTGYSNTGINEAIKDALEKAGKTKKVAVIETRGSQIKGEKRHYQVTLAAYEEK